MTYGIRILRLGLVIVLGTVATIATAGQASAVQPLIYPFAESGSEPIPCDGFEATLERSLSGTVMEFLDESGATDRVQIVTKMRGTLSADGMGTIDLTGNLVFVIDFANETWAFNGQVLQGTSPETGVAIQDTGRLLLDFEDNVIQLAGPHDAITDGAAAFCAALA